MKVLRDFFASIQWWRLEPLHEFVLNPASTNQERAVVAAPDDSFAVVYTPVRQTLLLDVRRLRGPVTATWPNPGEFIG